MGLIDNPIRLDLNNPVFQEHLFSLQKPERNAAIDTLRKIRLLSWGQLYRDNGLKWENIVSVKPPQGVDAIYSLRITQSRPAGMHEILSFHPERFTWYAKSVRTEVQVFMAMVVDSFKAVRNLLQDGLLACVKVGRSWIFPCAAFEASLNKLASDDTSARQEVCRQTAIRNRTAPALINQPLTSPSRRRIMPVLTSPEHAPHAKK